MHPDHPGKDRPRATGVVLLCLAVFVAAPASAEWQAGGEIGGYLPLAETREIYQGAPLFGVAGRRRISAVPVYLGGRVRLEPLINPEPANHFLYFGGWLDGAWVLRRGVALEASVGWTWRWIDLPPVAELDGGPAGRLAASVKLPVILPYEIWLGLGVEGWRASAYETVAQLQAGATIWFPPRP